mmetsp:Transcript_7317/g.18296  ORF Transcript_7317/g.18296 Transcript_7317/m.18296 type:complete len:397 (-) Transcript_7317:546-1736(-)
MLPSVPRWCEGTSLWRQLLLALSAVLALRRLRGRLPDAHGARGSQADAGLEDRAACRRSAAVRPRLVAISLRRADLDLQMLHKLGLVHALRAACGPREAATAYVLDLSDLHALASAELRHRDGRGLQDAVRLRQSDLAAVRVALVAMHLLRSQVQRRECAVELLIHHRKGVECNFALHRDILCSKSDGPTVGLLPIHRVDRDGHREQNGQQIRPLGPPQALEAPEGKKDRLDRCEHADDQQIHADAKGDGVVAAASAQADALRVDGGGVGQARHRLRLPRDRVPRSVRRRAHEDCLLHSEHQAVEAAGDADYEDPGPAHPNWIAGKGQQDQGHDDEVEQHEVPCHRDWRQDRGHGYAQNSQAQLLLRDHSPEHAVPGERPPHGPDRGTVLIDASHV